MKHITLITLAACIATSPAFLIALFIEPIEIQSKIIKLIDNGQVDIAKIALIASRMENLLAKKGIITFKGQPSTLKALVEFENNLPKKNPSPKDLAAVKNALAEAIKYIRENIHYYRNLLQKHKHSMKAIIEQWSVQRNKKDSLLLKWAKLDEEKFIKDYIQSAKQMNSFIEDLIILLKDVRFSCKKSNDHYEKANPEIKAAEDLRKQKDREEEALRTQKNEL